jgi:hypothetical protein
VSLRVVALAILAGWVAPATALGHPSPQPAGPQKPSLIPREDLPRYRSRVTAVRPPIPGLRVGVADRQDRLVVIWPGDPVLTVYGEHGEPMVQFEPQTIDINVRSPSVWRYGERFGRVRVPDYVDPSARPAWKVVSPPAELQWFDHRIHWMRGTRPPDVGDGLRPVTIRRWRIPVSVAGRRSVIEGVLQWEPDPDEVRAARSEVSSPLLSAAILAAALTLGAGIGVLIRRRVDARPGA